MNKDIDDTTTIDDTVTIEETQNIAKGEEACENENITDADEILETEPVASTDEFPETEAVIYADETPEIETVSDTDETPETEAEIVVEETSEAEELVADTKVNDVADPVVHYVSCLKHLFLYCFKLFFLMITTPLSVMESSKEDKSRFPMLFWGAMHLLVILGSTLIYIPFANEYISLDAKLVVGAFFVLIVATTILLHTIITFVFCRLMDKSTSFKNTLSYFSLATIPITLLIAIAFVFDYIFIPVSIVIYLLAYFGWILLSLKATEVALNHKGYAFWIHILNSILSLIATVALIAFIGLDVCKYFLNDLIIHIFSVENIATFIGSLDLMNFLQ